MHSYVVHPSFISFFFTHTATTEIYTLSLHDALPIFMPRMANAAIRTDGNGWNSPSAIPRSMTSSIIFSTDRKSTRLNSSHANISYAVFCLKKKKKKENKSQSQT